MRTLVTFGPGALTMYLFENTRTSNEPEAERPSETPQAAQHLGR